MPNWPEVSFKPAVINDFGFCWVCGGTQNLELHHIIPRAYGGEKGPQVSLCSICHASLDRIAAAGLESAAELRPGLTKGGLTRITKLVTIILAAKKATQNDPNKSIVFSDRFPAKTRRELRALSQSMKRSQSYVVRLAIAELHKRLIGG